LQHAVDFYPPEKQFAGQQCGRSTAIPAENPTENISKRTVKDCGESTRFPNKPSAQKIPEKTICDMKASWRLVQSEHAPNEVLDKLPRFFPN